IAIVATFKPAFGLSFYCLLRGVYGFLCIIIIIAFIFHCKNIGFRHIQQIACYGYLLYIKRAISVFPFFYSFQGIWIYDFDRLQLIAIRVGIIDFYIKIGIAIIVINKLIVG